VGKNSIFVNNKESFMKHLISTITTVLFVACTAMAQTPAAPLDFYPPSVVPDRMISTWHHDQELPTNEPLSKYNYFYYK
jgi:hypothetical protein